MQAVQSSPREPQRTCYLLVTPLALLAAWAPDITYRVLSFSHGHQERDNSVVVQLSIHIPLLILGCLNPWLYHKLSLRRCHGQCGVKICLAQQNATDEKNVTKVREKGRFVVLWLRKKSD